jgi:hypothetical protein
VLRRRILDSATRAHREEEGQAAFLVLLTVIIVFAMAGLSLDAGLWYFDHRTAQNQADAAALAGILELPASEAAAFTQVNEFLVKNGTDTATEGDGVCPTANDANYVDFVDETGDGEADTVIVCVRRQTSSVFSSLAGLNFVHVSAMATARLIAVPLPYALMALNETECSTLVVAGQGDVTVQGESESAGTYTRSTCNTGLALEGSESQLSADGENDTYSGSGNNRCLSNCDPPPTEEDYIEDPFAHVEPPSVPSSCQAARTFSSGVNNTLGPGCYLGLTVNGTGTVLTLSPGVYVMRGPVRFEGGAGTTVTSNGAEVLFYMTCSTGACPENESVAASRFTTQGQVSVSLKGHSDYENITIFVDRNTLNSETSAVRLAGQGAQNYEGAVYAVNSYVEVEGNGTGLSLNVAIVADTMRFAGNGAVTITYDIDLIPPEYQMALVE